MQARLMLRLHHLILISIHWHSWLYCEYLVQCSCLFFCHNDRLPFLFSVLTACSFLSWLLLRLVKLSLPNYGDFELLFSQIQQFITICSKEQIQFAGDKCKSLSNYSVWGRFVCLFFFPITFSYLWFTVAHLCHFITHCLVDLKQVRYYFKALYYALEITQGI